MDNQNQEKMNADDEGEQATPQDFNELASQGDGENWWADCDYCNAELPLSEEELSQGWYTCPECGQLSHLVDTSGVSAETVLQLPARDDDAEWVQLAEVAGAEEASLVVSYLQANGIEAFAWQEGAGRAFGLTIGMLGATHVMVRDDQAELARSILEAEAEVDLDGYEPADESLAGTSKAVMGLAAVTINPVGAGLAFGLSQVLGPHDDEDDRQDNLVECVNCQESLELSEKEITQGHYVCPECQQLIQLSYYVACPSCQAELALDNAEKQQGWYRCPECDQVTQL